MYTAYHSDNLTTAALIGSSLAGYVYAKKNKLLYQGFGAAIGVVLFMDYVHRREIDRTSIFSFVSS